MIGAIHVDSSLPGLIDSVKSNRQLIIQMIRREIIGRYQGSMVGILWSLLNPLFLLVVYAFVFSVVFKARWGVTANESRAQFALVLFAGLILHGFVAECLMKAPKLIIDNSNYVKKVVFPLEILPVVVVGAALFHALISYAVLLAGLVFFNRELAVSALLLPVLLMPMIIGLLGIVWLLASIGVFLRDVQQVLGMVVTALLFLTPIFFPASALPEPYQGWIYLNPLTFFVEQSRAMLIWGRYPQWTSVIYAYLGAIFLAWLGYFWFQKTRKGFSDVL